MKELKAKVEKITTTLEEQKKLETTANQEAINANKEYKEWKKKHETESDRKIKEEQVCTILPSSGPKIFGCDFGKDTRQCTSKLDAADVMQQQGKLRGFETQIQAARSAHLDLLKKKQEIQKENAGLYGELAELMGMKDSKIAKNDLERAQRGLEMSITVLALVKTIFLESLAFWKKLAGHAKSMGSKGDNMNVLKELGIDDADEFKELLVGSGFNWLAFGKVSYESAKAMHKVKADVTNTFVNLPSHDQAAEIVKTSGPLISTVKEMIKNLRKDDKATKKEIENAEKAIKKEKEIIGVLPEDRLNLTTTVKPSTVPPTTMFVIDLGGDLGGEDGAAGTGGWPDE